MDAEDEERGEEENIAMNSGEPGLVGGSPGQEDADDQHDGTVEGSDSAEAEQAGMADPVDADHQHPLIDAEEEDEEQVDYNRSPIIQHRQSPSPDREDPAESSSQERGPVEGGAEEDVGSGDAEGGEPVHAHHSLSPEDVIAAANEEEGAALARGSSPASQDLGGSRAEDNRAAGDGVAAGGEVSKGTGTEDQQPAEGPKEAATRANKYKKITYDIKGPTLPPLVPSSKGGKDGKDHKDGKDKQPGSASKQAGGSKLDQKDVKQDGKSSSKDVGREVKSSGKDVSKDVKSSNTDSKGRADDTARGGSERDKQRDIERERERERQREREKERERQRERERELRDRELRERELRDRDLRERELRDRELRERELRERERERARSQPRQDPRLRGDLHLGPPPPLRSLPPPLDRERDRDREWGVGRSGRSPPRGTYPPPPLPGMYNGGRSPPRVAVRSPPRPLGRSPPRGGGGGRSPPPRGVGRSPPRGPPGRSPPRARDPRDLLDRPPAGPDRYYREDVRVGPYDALRGPPRGPPGPGYRDPRDERPDRLPPPPLDYDRPAFDADHYRDRDRDRDLARDRDRDRDRGMDRGPLYGAGPPGYNSGYGAPRDPPPRDSYRPAALDRGSGFERGLPPGPRVVDAPPPRPDVVPYERSSARDRERDRDHDRGSDRGADPRRAPYPDQLPPASGSTRGGYGDRPLDAPRSSGGSGMDRGGYSGPDVRRPAAEPLVPLPRGATDRLPYDAGRGDRAPDGHGSREPWDRDSYRQPAGVAAGRGPASPPRHQAAARYDAPGQRSGFGSYPAPEYADGGRAGATDPRRPSHPADPRGPAPAKPAPATAYDRAPDVREARRAEPAPADSRDTAGYRFRGSGRLPSPPADMRGRTLDAAPGPAAKRVRVDEYSSRDAYGAAASGARYDVRGREAAEPLGRGADHYAAPGVAARVRDLGAPNDVSARREGTSGGSAGAAAGGNGMGSSAPRPVPGLAAAAVGAAGGGRTDPRAAADGRRVMDTAAVRQSGAAAYVSGSAPALGGGSRPAVSGATASRYQPEQQQADDDKVLKWFYLDPKGQKQGPCSIEQFKGWIETMSLQPSLSAQLQAFLAVDVWSQERPDYKRPLRALVPRK